MSDLKLYKGINNIDDDLIEEADCKQKPVIHHCYAIAASAAAIFVAAGATGLLHNSGTARKTLTYDNVVITNDNVPGSSAISENNCLTTSQSAIVTTQVPATSAKNSVSYSKTSMIQTNSPTQTTAVSADTAHTSAFVSKTVTETVNNDSSAVQNYDFEYEGSIIMKKYAAILSSLLTLTNGTATNAQQETYIPENGDIEYAEAAKTYIDENGIDLDINCDGTFDIFDLYAFYRAEVNDKNNKLVGTTVGTIPDRIWENYKAIHKDFKIKKTYTDSRTGEQAVGNYDFTFDTVLIMDYYFTYYNDIKLDYFEPDFYVDNCPDDFQDNFPYDFIRHDGKPWNMWDFQKTMYLKKESDGNYRFYNEDDAKEVPVYAQEYSTERRMRYMKDLQVSPIHEFISKLRQCTHVTGVDYPLMKEFVENGYADTDINSDETFDFEDIIKIATFSNRHSDCKEQTFIDHIFYPERNEFRDYFDNEYYTDIIDESEWNKAFSFCDTAANYFNIYTGDFLMYLTKYYLTYNEVDPKYFDPLYYEEKDLAHYDLYSPPLNKFFDYLGYYEYFSIKYGPKTNEVEKMSAEAEKRFNFTEDEVNAAFPIYYKNVKTGVLPKPDIDMNGKLDIEDYNILYNLSYEISIPYSYDYISTMIRRHPELAIDIDISQEIRDNFNTSFDFNNNGISGDSLEIDCMMMYILNDICSKYKDENEMNKAIDEFCAENPQLQYYEVFREKLENFNRERKQKFVDLDYEDYSADIINSINVMKSYSSFMNITVTGNGDANCDGTVDLSDAVLIMQSLADPDKYGINGSNDSHITEEGCFRADVDGEGVTTLDALTIQKYLLGLCSI